MQGKIKEAPKKRTIILHYHLFKNAGTSLDHILKQNFADRWVTAEFPASGGDNSGAVADWIRANPDAIAYSSHTAVGPVPNVEGVMIIPVLFLRDPIRRIRSAYQFEKNQQADTWGANLAKSQDFEGYVRTRLSRPNDRQCRNFQTARLASMVPGEAPELTRTLQALEKLHEIGVLGLVEDFDDALLRLTEKLRPAFPTLKLESVRANVSAQPATAEDSTELTTLLEQANRDDRQLVDFARKIL